MKKLMTMLLVVLATGMFAMDWYSSKEKVTDLKMKQTDSKDTLWYGYAPDLAYVWNLPYERATSYNLDDFTTEYPVSLVGFSSYLYDAGIRQSYKVYDGDGVTLLYQSPYFTSIKGYNDYMLDTPIVLKNDFWIAVTPDSAGSGLARHVSSSELTSTHSYIGTGDGTWELMENGGDYFEFETYAALATWEEADTFAPIVRSLTGLEMFENVVAELSLTVQDQNPVVSPMASQYSIDGGSTWVDFDMTFAVKSNQKFIGSIPGQVDGTTAIVKFNMADTLGNSTWSNDYSVTWSRDLPLLNESFEGDFPPAGWEQIIVGSGFAKGTVAADGIQAHTGEAALTHFDTEFDNDDWIMTPTISIPATNSCTFSFWQNGYWMSYYVFHEVAITTDNGATWTQIYTGAPPVAPGDLSGDVGTWEQLFFTLGTYAGQDIRIGFHYMGNYVDQWYIDDVQVVYDYEGPAIVDLMGNAALDPVVGAYVNNNMILNLTAFDLSGVQSITGHYAFTGDSVATDVVFSKAKAGNELWTGTIPAQPAVISGTINFDMVDIGGLLAPTTSDYAIEFVADADAPVVTNVSGTLAFLNNDMTIKLEFEDESAITSCSGYYTKDSGANWWKFDLTSSKIHQYTYLGTIPAETTEVFDTGFVYFEVKDEAGNLTTTGQYQVQFLDGQENAFEDFESGLTNWGMNGVWGLETGTYISADNALTESPNADYTENNTSFAMWANPMDWSSYFGGEIYFWTKWDLEESFDYMYFEGSGDNGMTWVRLNTYNGEGVNWHEEKVSMDAFAGDSQVTFRFLFISDGGYETNGMYIDDLRINTYNTDIAPPTIISDPYAPVYYEGTLGDYVDAIEVTDISGVAQVDVTYSVDGGADEVVSATYNAGTDMWDFTIPTQMPGALVSYMFTAADASPRGNVATKGPYSYIAGEHLIYDTNEISYIDELKDNAAWAERITIDTDLTQWAQVVSFLFRNYYDPTHISTTMQAHVWADNGGVPGVELIPAFDVTPVAGPGNPYGSAIVDLNSYVIRTNGDIWVGCSAPYGSVHTTYENTSETGGTDYARSYAGTWTGSDWTWALNAGNNYHIRGIIGEKTGIEGNSNLPTVTELEQNYPNPFNPTTTINFNLAKDSKVSLVVYDVMGREVANLVNNNMVRGSHKVSFDASSLVSGVYYYNLKAGDVNQTKKMMLIK